MDANEVASYIREAFPGVETTEAYGYTFFFYGSERMLPFATLATADNEHDRVSDLDRDGAYRLNIGVSRDTYRSLLGDEKPRLGPAGRPHRRLPVAIFVDGTLAGPYRQGKRELRSSGSGEKPGTQRSRDAEEQRRSWFLLLCPSAALRE